MIFNAYLQHQKKVNCKKKTFIVMGYIYNDLLKLKAIFYISYPDHYF